MKLTPSFPPILQAQGHAGRAVAAARSGGPLRRAAGRRDERGTALLVVLALLVLIMAFMAGNNVTLRALKQELQILDKHQLQKYGPLASTNRVATPTEAAKADR